jgi:hypothetical protein
METVFPFDASINQNAENNFCFSVLNGLSALFLHRRKMDHSEVSTPSTQHSFLQLSAMDCHNMFTLQLQQTFLCKITMHQKLNVFQVRDVACGFQFPEFMMIG